MTTTAGTVYTLGTGDIGQLGHGEEYPQRKKPSTVRAIAESKVHAADSGALHNVVATESGEIWSWGVNDDCALGRDGPENLPGKVEGVEGGKVKKVTCGDNHSVVLLDSGKLYTWGTYKDSAGPLGFSASEKKAAKPVLVDGPAKLSKHKVIDIASGANHTIALTEKGEVFCWGDGELGQLGRRVMPRTKITSTQPTEALRVVRSKKRKAGEAVPKKLTKYVKVFAGANHSFALGDDGVLYGWGLNNYGQLGIGSMDRDVKRQDVPHNIEKVVLPEGVEVKDVKGGENHTVLLTLDQRVFACGRGDYGQLGQGNKDHSPSFKEIEGFGGEAVTAIGTGSNHSFAVTATGKAFVWGFGDGLQLGTGEEDDEEKPVRLSGKMIEDKKVIVATGGSSHTLLVAA